MAQSSTMPSLAPEVQAFVQHPASHADRRRLGGGRLWKTFPVYDPATEEVIAHVAEG